MNVTVASWVGRVFVCTGLALLPSAESFAESAESAAGKSAGSERWSRAIVNDQADRLQSILSSLSSDQIEATVRQRSPNGKSALMVASKAGQLGLMQQLVASGADVDGATETGGTAFMFAVLGNRQSAAEWLLRQGADIDAEGSNGWSAMTIAAAKGHAPMIDWLIEQGGDPTHVDVYGFTPLMRAADNGHLPAVRRLLGQADARQMIDHQDEVGNTALLYAVATGSEAIARVLIAAGADPSRQNRDGVDARTLARTLPDTAHWLKLLDS